MPVLWRAASPLSDAGATERSEGRDERPRVFESMRATHRAGLTLRSSREPTRGASFKAAITRREIALEALIVSAGNQTGALKTRTPRACENNAYEARKLAHRKLLKQE
ncbi:hypothetical protein MRX96_029460 [Rhipicephalus microplus]